MVQALHHPSDGRAAAPRARRIRFIEPSGREGRPFNAWLSRWPLLGPITLATILHERGYDAAVYNENLSGPLLENRPAYEDICAADVVGISIMTPTAARGYALADRLRRDAPQAKIAFGGAHATFLPEEALAHGDIVVCGEGESVIEQIARGDMPDGIVRAVPLADLDQVPTLRHDLMRDFDQLLARCRRRELYELPVVTSRGCPHACTYCSVTQMFGRQVRRQSPDKVLRDVETYMARGFRRLFFYDDNFTSDRTWSQAVLGRLAPMGLRFNAQVRADFQWLDARRRRLDESLLEAMHKAGGDVLYIGYETIDDATAREWHKGYRGDRPLRERLLEDTHILHSSGFWIHGMFVLGPQHTSDTADGIVRFARQAKIESIQISILTPLPGTALFREMQPHLVFRNFPADWDYYDGTHCVYNHSRLGIEGIQKALLDAHARFYRWGGLSLRRIRALVEQKIPIMDKLALFWGHARLARTTLRKWRDETRLFLEATRAVRAQSP